jgi:hypothetical protein
MTSLHKQACAAIAAATLFLLGGLPAAANTHNGNGMGAAVPPGHAMVVPQSVHNPNGTAPIGKPAVRGPDTDRGMSEGKGHTDTMHTSMSRSPMKARLISLTRTTATVRLANGTLQTFMISGDTFGDLNRHIGQRVVFRTSNGTLIPVSQR